MIQVLGFLQELSENNNREWFRANKKRYDESRDKMLFITNLIINEIRKFDSDIPALDPNDCLFRIFRDVRFSHDKSPYKTNFGSFVARGGRKSTRAGYYFHIDPSESFAGGGIYMPEAEILKTIREHISENGDEFLTIINQPEFKKIFPEMMDDKLKTAPKGFDPVHEFIDIIRYRSYVFSRQFSKTMVTSENYVATLVDTFRVLYPFNRFLNDALDRID